MAFKNYRIEIIPRGSFVLPEYIPANFGCAVSEPSVWANTWRGLTFTDEEWSSLDDHSMFIHLYTFNRQLPNHTPVEAEINKMIWDILTTANITPSQVNVKVTYANSTL